MAGCRQQELVGSCETEETTGMQLSSESEMGWGDMPRLRNRTVLYEGNNTKGRRVGVQEQMKEHKEKWEGGREGELDFVAHEGFWSAMCLSLGDRDTGEDPQTQTSASWGLLYDSPSQARAPPRLKGGG